MKLIDLLEAIGEGYCSFDTAEIIQICEPNMDWDNFSEFHVGSQLLKPFVDFEVDCIGAIAENVIRVALYNEDFCGVKGYFPMPCKVGDTVYEILEETVPERYAKKLSDGTPEVCAAKVGYLRECPHPNVEDYCKECWNTALEE